MTDLLDRKQEEYDSAVVSEAAQVACLSEFSAWFLALVIAAVAVWFALRNFGII